MSSGWPGIPLLALAVLMTQACGGAGAPRVEAGAAVIDPGDGGNYAPTLTAAEVVPVIDNPYLPLKPGSTWTYEGEVDGEPERVTVVVTPERRQVMGISTVVVRDTVTDRDGAPVEITDDWFAQDRAGNVWYLGEASKDYQDGKVISTDGSWEAGVGGARPGIVMPATPAVGAAYRQEYSPGDAEDMGEVIRLGASERVRAGEYGDLVVTKEWTPLEPDIVEEKYYAPGVGLVLARHVAGHEGRLELTAFTRGK